jgi:RNA polymerase-binding transcription factor DksA
MNQEFIEECKGKLLAEQKRIRAILGREDKFDGKGEFPGEYQPKFTEVGSEDGENASEVEQFANDLSVTADLEEKLTKIEAALKRITDGTYGQCAMGDEIEEARLRAVPEAETCINHAK